VLITFYRIVTWRERESERGAHGAFCHPSSNSLKPAAPSRSINSRENRLTGCKNMRISCQTVPRLPILVCAAHAKGSSGNVVDRFVFFCSRRALLCPWSAPYTHVLCTYAAVLSNELGGCEKRARGRRMRKEEKKVPSIHSTLIGLGIVGSTDFVSHFLPSRKKHLL
jgi:hypothetical protein